MNVFSRMPLRPRLLAIMMLTTLAALVIAFSTITVYEYNIHRESTAKQFSVLAEVLGENVAAAIQFDDREGARQILQGLHVQPDIECATLFDSSGRVFATYLPGGVYGPEMMVTPEGPATRFKDDHLYLHRGIDFDGDRVGSILIRANLSVVRESLLRFTCIFAILGVASLIVAYIFSRQLQGLISKPILALAELSGRVSVERDYAVRAAEEEGGEIGQLVHGFNEMLAQIEKRDRQLQQHRQHLEEEVAARTDELVKLNEDLTRARDRAEEALRIKSQFLANMSHEIRTPMNVIVGMTEIALESELRPEVRDYLDAVSSSAEVLLALISDLLDFSRLEADKLILEEVPFDLAGLLDQVGEELALSAEEKGLELVIDGGDGTPQMVRGDPLRMRQVITNLLANAIKFTERGHVLVSLRRETWSGTSAWYALSVEDTGIGIAEEQQREVFSMFTQADSSTVRRFGGTGLGLAISKQLVGLMGGVIGVRSEPQRGSTFWFKVPLKVRGPERSRDPGQMLAWVRSLIVSPSGILQRTMMEQMRRLKMLVRSAEGAEEALEALLSAAADGRPYEVAVIDVGRAQGRAIDLLRRVRATPELRTTALVLLVPARMGAMLEELRRHGAQACMLKPIRLSRLRKVLRDALHRKPGQDVDFPSPVGRSAPSAPAEGEAAPPIRVLLVEDSEPNQMVATLMSKSLGCEVDVASNGCEAVERAREESYDIILMDCQMPQMDGYEATAAIRDLGGRWERTPIVALTAHAMPGDREKCLRAGMDDYVTKPVRTEVLREILQRWVTSRADPEPERGRARQGAG